MTTITIIPLLHKIDAQTVKFMLPGDKLYGLEYATGVAIQIRKGGAIYEQYDIDNKLGSDYSASEIITWSILTTLRSLKSELSDTSHDTRIKIVFENTSHEDIDISAICLDVFRSEEIKLFNKDLVKVAVLSLKKTCSNYPVAQKLHTRLVKM